MKFQNFWLFEALRGVEKGQNQGIGEESIATPCQHLCCMLTKISGFKGYRFPLLAAMVLLPENMYNAVILQLQL